MLEKSHKVIAIEKDRNLAEQLKQNFREQILDNRLEIIEADILDYNLTSKNYKLIGNIPYYITGALFKKVFESENLPQSITFVIQKEVAHRIIAKDNKESILSISIKAYGKPEYGGIIKAGSFYPKPKVDSAIISVRDIKKLKDLNIEKFFRIVRTGFAHKRKLLIKNLGVDKKTFEKCSLPEKARAEDLKVEGWIYLTRELM